MKAFRLPRKVQAVAIFVLEVLLPSVYSSKLFPELQPDDVDSAEFNKLRHNRSYLCLRECEQDEPPRLCYYKFHLEPYTVLNGACGLCPKVKSDCYNHQCITADGFERAILTVNRRLPGPSIQVCKGDTIVVDVTNQMPGSSTSIHWHGIWQLNTPWMDGVPMVTQCPIMEGQTFQYRFKVQQAGTFFWHSHDGYQKVDGVVGSLIIREAVKKNVLQKFYDVDMPSHIILVQDWMHTSANDRSPGFLRENTGQSPDSYLINGRGIHMTSMFDLYRPHRMPLAKFTVKKGHRHLFRIIGGTSLSCPFIITFDKHRLTVVSSDSNPIKPVVVDSVVLSSGERYNVVVDAHRSTGSYWITVRGLGVECHKASQVAVLHYEDSQAEPLHSSLTPPLGVVLNPWNANCDKAALLSEGVCVSHLQSLLPNPPRLSHPPDLRLFMPFGFHLFNSHELFNSASYHRYFVPLLGVKVAGLVNNVSFKMPPSPLLTQLEDVPPSEFCGVGFCPAHEICECINLIKIPLGSVVEFVIVDTTPPNPLGLSHPFHMHGYDFYVVEQGIGRVASHQLHTIERNSISEFLPLKDTVNVPSAGYAVVRILANNPGFWLFHCHFTYHLSTGMSAVIQVGETFDIPSPPPHFPRCNQFLPSLYDFHYHR